MPLTGERSEAWRSSPFPLLVCMPFKRPETVLEVWSSFIKPTLASLGEVVRIDWMTDDWVRDLREVTAEVAFVLIDLTNTKPSVIRELHFMLQEKIPVICYMNRPQGVTTQLTTVGMIDPQTATHSWGGSLDLEILGHHVYTANYNRSKDLYELCNYLKRKLVPFQDRDDPSSVYLDSDISLLPQEEQEGFFLARIPRSRIIGMSDYWRSMGAKNYWERAQQLFRTSAIYRARVFSWLENPNLLLDSSKNLWVRENLLLIVLHDVRSGNRLTSSEYRIIAELEQEEPSEDIRLLISDIRDDNHGARSQALAVQRGMPAVPPKKILQSPKQSNRVLIRVDFDPSGRFSGLRATEWKSGFPNSEGVLVSQIGKIEKDTLRPRLFNIQAVGTIPVHLEGRWGEIEDVLDQLAPKLMMLVSEMISIGWSPSDIEITVRVVLSLKAIIEIERRDVKTKWADQFHIDLKRYLGHIWGRNPKELYLFEFSSSYYKSHFRGLLLWPDIRESAMQLYARIVAPMLEKKGLSEEAILRQAMEWDLPPAQLWDIILLQRMNEAAPTQLIQQQWVKYVLPSAVLYWSFEDIFVDPSSVDRWAYVMTQDMIDEGP